MFSHIRSKRWSYGPILPKYLLSPNVININDYLTFISGITTNNSDTITICKPLKHHLQLPQHEAYVFNEVTHEWTNVGSDFPCSSQFMGSSSSAYLRLKKSVIILIDNGCFAILNLTLFPNSWTWASLNSPKSDNGIVFNRDMEQSEVYFIANDRKYGSDVYTVCLRLSYFLILACYSYSWGMF